MIRNDSKRLLKEFNLIDKLELILEKIKRLDPEDLQGGPQQTAQVRSAGLDGK